MHLPLLRHASRQCIAASSIGSVHGAHAAQVAAYRCGLYRQIWLIPQGMHEETPNCGADWLCGGVVSWKVLCRTEQHAVLRASLLRASSGCDCY